MHALRRLQKEYHAKQRQLDTCADCSLHLSMTQNTRIGLHPSSDRVHCKSLDTLQMKKMRALLKEENRTETSVS
jgi:hypothetical protein